MKRNPQLFLGSAVFGIALLAAPLSDGQQKTASAKAGYDLTRETLVLGTVVSYTATSTVAPIGPHATIQTSSGTVDVHLGSATLMKQNDIFLVPGDSVKIVGESQTFGGGTVFVARILQKGSQTVTLRNLNGIPIIAKPSASARQRSILGGAQ